MAAFTLLIPTGNVLNDQAIPFAMDFENGVACIRQDSLYVFVNKSLEQAIPGEFQQASRFGNGLAPVMQGGFWGYVGLDGSMAIPYRYRYAHPFRNGTAIVWDEIGPGYITTTGIHLGYLLDDK